MIIIIIITITITKYENLTLELKMFGSLTTYLYTP